MLLRNQLAVTVVILGMTLSALAKETSVPSVRIPEPVKVGAYPTQVVATVRSLKIVRNADDDLGGDVAGRQTICLVKLRIHATRALTLLGTPVGDEESIIVISPEPLDTALIGQTVRASIEMRGDVTRQRWLLTDLVRAKSRKSVKR